MSTIGDLCVTSSVSSDDKLPIWQNANGVTRALPISVLDSRYLTQADVALLAASATVETFVAGVGFTPGVSLALTLANQYYSAANIEVFFDAAFQGPDQYSLAGLGLVFISPIPVGVQNVYVRGGAARLVGTPSDGTVTTVKIVDGAVTLSKLASQSVNDSKIVTGSKLYNRINDVVSITDYGGSTAISDNSAALLAAIAACPTGRRFVFIPPGQWKFAANVTYNMVANESVSIVGAGSDVTELTWAAGGGLTFNATDNSNSVRIRDMSLTTSTTGTGTAITLNGPSSVFDTRLPAQSDISNVTVRGADGYQTANYWNIGALAFCFHNVNVINTQFIGPSGVGGIGFKVFGTAINPAYPFNFIGSSFNHLSAGIYIGSEVQGVTIQQCNFTAAVGVGSSYGIQTDPAATPSSLVQLSVIGNQFTVNSSAVFLPVGVTGTNINDNFIFVPPGAFGLTINGTLFTITGNNIIGQDHTTTGIKISTSLGPGTVTGNQLNSLGVGINLDVTSFGVNVQSNAYGSNTTNVINSGGGGNTVGGGSQ